MAIIVRIPRVILLFILRAYKYAISPLFLPACRYVPTCSEYAAEAVERHGFLRGSVMSGWRLLRCNPFVRGGFDPVPTTELRSHMIGPRGPITPDEGVRGYTLRVLFTHRCSHH